jgi:hypothetical protein
MANQKILVGQSALVAIPAVVNAVAGSLRNSYAEK